MKRIAVIFAALFLVTLLIPLVSQIQNSKEEKEEEKELVTIFSSDVSFNPCGNYSLQIQDLILQKR